ncbi:MAG: hypothetical protein KGY42_08730 [Desulfobacterales bacterium]|nr:hypothetical protein [Desulfobacterales bacterium]MBS3754868.1 hypothetical protein [Desulfobacterales bacterium]
MKPLKTKIFTYFTLNINPPNELQINQWLAANPGIEIVDMLQSESMTTRNGEIERNLSITIVYRESEQAQS